MKVNPYIFRGYDIRGEVDKDLNLDVMEAIGKAHGTYLQKRGVKEAIVGHDCRSTSQEYSDAFIKGLAWTGVDVVDIGMTMVGTFYWSQYYLKIKGGAFITASHNPAEYNGLKLAADFSETLVSDGIEEIKATVLTDNYTQGEKPGSVVKQDISDAYFDDILKRFPNLKPMKVLVDPGHTTAGSLVPKILKRAGLEVIEKHCNIDASFPLGTPDPTESAVVERLSRETKESGADVGFTYDADGDRIGIVDEKGGIIWNDVLVAIFASDVLDHHPGSKIMFNTLCSKVVQETIEKHNGVPYMWRTGHSFLKKKNQEVKAAFIGELSGHFFFSADFYNHDDGIYSTIRLLDFLSRTGKTLSETVDSLPKYISSPEIKIGCPDDKKVALMDKIGDKLRQDYPDAQIISDERAGDGVRLDLPDSMFVIRYSQNGPYLTIKFESLEQKKYDELRAYISDLLKEYAEIDWSFGANLEEIK